MSRGSQQLTSLHLLLEAAGKDPSIGDYVVLAGSSLSRKMKAQAGIPRSTKELDSIQKDLCSQFTGLVGVSHSVARDWEADWSRPSFSARGSPFSIEQ